MSVEKTVKPIIYPERDGKRMSDNTEQFRWIVTIEGGLEWLYANDPEVFVAGDLLWYPVQGEPKIRQAPDAMVAIGRPKGKRGSYLQWQEADVIPQVVFEVLSPGNTRQEMASKREFYEKYGVEEYYEYDPDRGKLLGWVRRGEKLAAIQQMQGWESPRMKVKFGLNGKDLELTSPKGELFVSFVETKRRAELNQKLADHANLRAEQEAQRAEREAQRAKQEMQKAEQEKIAKEKAWAKLRELGINPETL